MADVKEEEMEPQIPNEQEENVMKILIATDNHIGFMEKDSVRGGDALETFKEILSIAKRQNVDFILLGGDLFHDNKPSHHIIFKTMELLRQYCIGARPCPIEFRSDASINFKSSFPTVNYEDPNYNISIPIFSIHGNHDDPTGDHYLSSMDILSVANLVNYFGSAPDVEDISISPVLLQKGDTKLAMYGLGSIRDERLNRAFKHRKVKFLQPKEERSNWFNLFVIHQNRSRHSATNFIPATFLPSFLDLVVWGHEHEAHTSPEYQALADVGNLLGQEEEEEEEEGRNGFYIYQPGSSVATSLSEGEVAHKHVGLLHIKGTDFCLNTIRLKTVRPFVIDILSLSKSEIEPLDHSAIIAHLTQKVEELIERAKSENPDSDKLPIIRLKVDYSDGYSILNQARFCQYFVDKVANPKTILQWYRKKQQSSLGGGSNSNDQSEDMEVYGPADDEEGEQQSIGSLLKETLIKDKLVVLSEKNLLEAVDEFVVKNEKEATLHFVNHSLKKTQEILETENFPESELIEQLEKKRDEIMKRQEETTSEVLSSVPRTDRFSEESDTQDSDKELVLPPSTSSRGRGRGRGRGTSSTRGKSSTRGTTSRGRGRKGSTTSNASISSTAASVTTPQLTLPATLKTPASRTTSTSSTRRSKAAVIYADDSDEEELNPKKKAKLKPSETVDLTQDSDDDGNSSDNPFDFPSKRKR